MRLASPGTASRLRANACKPCNYKEGRVEVVVAAAEDWCYSGTPSDVPLALDLVLVVAPRCAGGDTSMCPTIFIQRGTVDSSGLPVAKQSADESVPVACPRSC